MFPFRGRDATWIANPMLHNILDSNNQELTADYAD
jgi:hypothetical protein